MLQVDSQSENGRGRVASRHSGSRQEKGEDPRDSIEAFNPEHKSEDEDAPQNWRDDDMGGSGDGGGGGGDGSGFDHGKWVEEATKVVRGLVKPVRSASTLERNKRGQAYVTPLPASQDQIRDQRSPSSQAGRGEQMPQRAEHRPSDHRRGSSNAGVGESERASGERVSGEQRPSGERRRRRRTSERRSDAEATEQDKAAVSPMSSEMRDARLQTSAKSFRARRGSGRHRQSSGGVGGEDASLGQTHEQGAGEQRASSSWKGHEDGSDESHRSDVEKEGRRRKRRSTVKGRGSDAEGGARGRAAQLDGGEEDMPVDEVLNA